MEIIDILKYCKEMIKQRNQNAYAREQSYIHWVDPYTRINHNKLGSSQAWKIEKSTSIMIENDYLIN
jgi:hypothetical protein